MNLLLQEALERRASEHRLRRLSCRPELLDFCSNDYLGLARSKELEALVRAAAEKAEPLRAGSTGSRLISGNSAAAEDLERELAQWLRAESALVFNSGYDADLGLFSCLPRRGDTVLYDELCHASIRDGVRLSFAQSFGFRHNDTEALRAKLTRARGNIFVAVESVYSMDGDYAPLEELVRLCEERGAALIVDEAHATGLYGPRGEGRAAAAGLERRVFARVHTFGKALGVHGAAVLGGALLREYLINFCRPFIYTTALPPRTLLAVRAACRYAAQAQDLRAILFERAAAFRACAAPFADRLLPAEGAVQGVMVPGNERAAAASRRLAEEGFDVRAILSPTVPAGSERLRVCLHAFNGADEVQRLCGALAALPEKCY